MCFGCTNKLNAWNISTGDKFATEKVQTKMLASSKRPSDKHVDINKGRFIQNFIRQKWAFRDWDPTGFWPDGTSHQETLLLK